MVEPLRAALRRLFLVVEGAFNAAFGDRLNPFYCLGAIAYWLFWIVVVSGFYVYAFYDTGVETTYASVERITHAQWWAGGVMRSAHRYASAAMVVAMLLHLARHFAFDRYRGFRAFSWLTGVLLLVLVYASGVNGYMLPWDKLAQFTVIATAELLDALPVFRGSLVRNFILPEAITDRFFSLLSFLHIGIPLAVLAALWVHTQRVPRARTSPPRETAIGTVLMLLVLSLVFPAVSQGPADFASTPTVLSIDWFYLALHALLYTAGSATVWWISGVAAALLLLAPWLPPKRRGADASLTIHPGNRTVGVQAGETLLDAGLRGGVPLPFECRSGGCGLCKATVLNGAVEPGIYQRAALSDGERAAGKVLLCCATAEGDVEIEYEAGAAVREQRRAPGQARARRDAGRPAARRRQARRLRGGPVPQRAAARRGAPRVFVHRALRRDRPRRAAHPAPARRQVHLPGVRPNAHGRPGAFRGAARRVRAARAVGTAAHLRRRRDRLRAGEEPGDLYLAELPERWAAEHPNFRFVPVLSEPLPEDDWTGRTGLVHEAILADFPDLSGFAVYACGSVRMVEAARPAFVAQGLAEDFCYSDAFVASAASSPA